MLVNRLVEKKKKSLEKNRVSEFRSSARMHLVLPHVANVIKSEMIQKKPIFGLGFISSACLASRSRNSMQL